MGRRKHLEDEQFLSAILKYKDEILTEDNKLVSKQHVVWEKISIDLNKKYLPSSLYSKVCTIKNEILLKLTGTNVCPIIRHDVDGECLEDSIDSSKNSSIDEESSPHLHDNQTTDSPVTEIDFSFFMSQGEMDNITEYVLYNRNDRSGNTRVNLIFKPDKYKDFFRNKVWDATHMKCGFHFRNPHIAMSQDSGTINGEFFASFYSIELSFTLKILKFKI